MTTGRQISNAASRRLMAGLALLLAVGWGAPPAQSSGRASSRSSKGVAVRKTVDWPNPKKARRALAPRNFKQNIVDPALRDAEVVAVDGGREAFAIGGAFGTVFKVQVRPQRFVAFRVFHPENGSVQASLESGRVQRRYKRIERRFDALEKKGQLPPELVQFEYVSKGYKLGKRTFPALKMPWLTAQPLDSWVRGRLDGGKPDALRVMARNWRRAMRDLNTIGLAHGDLRDANILVEGDGTMRFVDYDAIYIDEISDDKNSELGHPNYQHPAFHARNPDRSRKRPYDRKLDNFSSIVVYLSLLAVAEDPGLWDRFNDDFQLIFDKSDLADPDSSPVFEELSRSSNSAVRQLSKKLAGYAKGAPEDVPTLEEALASGRSGKPPRGDSFGKRETGGVVADEVLIAEQGGDARLVKRTLGIRSVRALGSARTGEEYDEKASGTNGNDDAVDVATGRGRQASRKQSVRASVRAQGTSRGRPSFEQVVPLIEGALPRVSTGNPGLLLVLTDNSSSMGSPFAGTSARKSEALADVVNQTLDELVGRFRSGDRIKDTMDVAAYSYSGDTVRPALGGTLAGKGVIPLPELAAGVSRVIDDVDDNGEPFSQPIWVEPSAGGNTPMTRGFSQARSALTSWRQQRQPTREHLILAVHVTDGESTDGDPTAQIRALASDVAAQNGKLLLTNIHLSSNGSTDAGVVFPTEADAAGFDQFGQRLFRQSSVVPEGLRLKLNRMGRDIKPGARMMAFNASVDDLAFLFEAGSSSAIDD